MDETLAVAKGMGISQMYAAYITKALPLLFKPVNLQVMME